MAAKSAASIATKWAQRLGQSAEAIREGVNAVTTSPGETAAQNAQRYLDGVTEAYNSGRYQKGLRSFTLEDWKTAMIQKGVSRISSGAQAAVPKVVKFQEYWLPQMEELKRRISGMAKGGVAEAQARAAAAIAFNAGLKGKAPR